MNRLLQLIALTYLALPFIPAFASDQVQDQGPSALATSRALELIAQWNERLSAVISVNPHALDDARKLDQQQTAGKTRSPLHGVPILIKDNIETRELPTTAGSLALAGNDTGRDAALIESLRTAGLVSRRGIVPIAHSQDTAGPMAFNVRDAAHLLNAMTAYDPRDEVSQAAKPYFERDYSAALKIAGLEGKRIGVVRSLAGFHETVDERFDQAVKDLATAGASIVDDLEFPQYPGNFSDASYNVLLYEFKYNLNRYLSGLPGDAGRLTLEKLIAFNQKNAESEMHWFGQDIFLQAQEKSGLDSAEYREALTLVQTFSRTAINDLLAGHDLDLFVSPSNTPAWSIDLVVGDHFLGGSSSFPARAGYPHITVPMGQVHGLPVGLSFFSTAFSEPVLIEAAFAYEQATLHAQPPQGYGKWQPAVAAQAGNKE